MVGQASGEFVAPALDGLAVQPGDARELTRRRSRRLSGESGDVPAALGFTQVAQEQVDLLVVLHQWEISSGLAGGAFALMDRWFKR